ncbi:GrxB family glutaredoxin [Aphanomyces astaci]|uniref:GrxB family glutaredoxin n=1 Tax=Aphanomyces astaci TaxID=112090 RepID=W4GY60_APHAT|nr:GrxB family glutaredoxin [Aphanomyces astaci]ETV84655.1 GrxB family glutaredoxin [Aphanomyces astaci]|eukprot:XP_009826347.1 GrxB family glutaredoxin [Aphanomyces astaci]
MSVGGVSKSVVLAVLGSLGVGASVGYRLAASLLTNKAAAVQTTKPRVYIYDHCPFSTRVRAIFALKGVDVEIVFLQNRDEATPIALVGSKVVPILETPDGLIMKESMDIVRYVDTHLGGKPILAESEAASREDLKMWLQDSADVMNRLYHPRAEVGYFAEFAEPASRAYYRKKKEPSIGPFELAIANSPAYVETFNQFLVELEGLLRTPKSVNDTLSYDDIDLFGRLRRLTIVKNVVWPPKVRAYIDHYETVTGVSLLDSIAQF